MVKSRRKRETLRVQCQPNAGELIENDEGAKEKVDIAGGLCSRHGRQGDAPLAEKDHQGALLDQDIVGNTPMETQEQQAEHQTGQFNRHPAPILSAAWDSSQ